MVWYSDAGIPSSPWQLTIREWTLLFLCFSCGFFSDVYGSFNCFPLCRKRTISRVVYLLWVIESIVCVFCVLGTNRYFRKVAGRMNIETSFVDATDLELVRSSMKPNTKVSFDRHSLKLWVGYQNIQQGAQYCVPWRALNFFFSFHGLE